MKRYLTFLFLILFLFTNAQIITNDTKIKETKQKERSEIKKNNNRTKENQDEEKTSLDLFFGVQPVFTNRILKINEGLFAKPLGIRAEEKGEWTNCYNVGLRSKINRFLKIEIGAGYYANRESFDYTEKDSVYRYVNTYRNVAFPINLAFSYGNRISFYAGAGIAPKAFVSMKQELTVLDINGNEKTTTEKIRDKFNLFLIDINASVGTQIKLSDNLGVFAMAVFRKQIINNYNKQSPYMRFPYSYGFNLGIEVYL